MSELNNRPIPDILDESTSALREAPIPAGPPSELIAATVAALHNRLGNVPGEQLQRQRRRRIMRYVGLSTAAAALLGTAALLWLGGSRAVALEQVLERVKQAESVTFVERQKLGDQDEITLKYSIRGPMVRADAIAGGAVRQIFIADTKNRVGLMVIPDAKAYMKIDKDSPSKIHGPAGKSPIDDLLALKDRKAESTVEEKLDGKTVQKLTIPADPKANPPGEWVIWVDPKTQLPVKMTYRGTSFAGDKEVPITKTYEQFEWNAKLEEKNFDMSVPEGYTEGFPGQVPPPPEVLFVTAMDRAVKAKSMRAITTLDAGDGQKLQMKVYYQDESMRSEVAEPGLVAVMDGKRKKGLLLFTQMKTAQWLDLEKNAMAAKIATDVAGSMKVFGQMKSEKVSTLPDETLDGRKLKVYELKAVKVKELPGETDIKIWIDPKTLLPARTELRHTQDGKKTVITLDVLGWNEELDEKLFELKVPAGYKVIEQPQKK